MSKCLSAPILIAVPIREAIPVADRALGLQDQAVLVLGDHLALVRVDLVVLVMMTVRRVEILVIVLRAAMIGALLVTVRRAEILVIVLLVVMIAVRMIGPLVVILVIVPRVAMIGALTTVRLVVILVTVRLVVMIGVLMIGRLVATALVLVGRLVRAVMTVVMVGDEAVPVKKTLLPGSRAMRRSAGVQQFVPAVRVPYERTWSKLQCRVSPNRGLMRVPLKVPVFNPWSATARV